ncbi:P protein isoform X2 [Episyrphus balteatus]|uniref:P protein isoform X2 n=1 Tax=Episyrphus balteatus TaxID=286459 RepID=UPI00248626A8|nr:P protein isoform X2 [Episyrphus balteatus]
MWCGARQRRQRRRQERRTSLLSDEVTEGALQIWRTLPEKIRQDPSLASFRQEHERLHAGEALQDEDPLPSEDMNALDEATIQHNNNSIDPNAPIRINITNELGQMHGIDGRGHNTKIEHSHQIDDMMDTTHDHKKKKWPKWTKIIILLIVWGLFTGFLMTTNEKVVERKLLSVPPAQIPKDFIVSNIPKGLRLGVTLDGAFASAHTTNNLTTSYLYVFVQLLYLGKEELTTSNESTSMLQEELQITHTQNLSEVWKLPLLDEELFDFAPEVRRSKVFTIDSARFAKIPSEKAALRIRMKADANRGIPLQFSYDDTPINKDMGVVYAALVLCGLYIMIIWEVVNRTFAAIIASTMAIGILAALDERPPMAQIMSWIDVETLLLLFGMMILVAILSETGIFDYLAVFAYKITNGKVWPLINCLCLFTAVMSSFLDNVTTVLLMTPVTIRLCEVMGLNPVPILMCMIIYSNIGGALTPVGDPPNVIIASNSFIAKNGVNFTVFTAHMLIGVLVVMVQTYIQLRYKFRNINDLRFNEAQDVQELRHEITVWQRAAASLSSYSKDEDLVRETLTRKVNRLKRNLKKKINSGATEGDTYEQTLGQLQAKYPIRSKSLLYKSGVALVFVISLFFLHSVPEMQRLSLGWTALLGAILLLILADREDMESVLARVEWSTLLFFAALFILMESLSELGLIDWIGKMTVNVILSVGEEHRLAVAVLLILWVSAIASAFVDNIPLTTMMIKIAISLAQNKDLHLPLQPLVWALAFGACLGESYFSGNGTLIGASANVVCAGVAEQHGYRFTFLEYFKVGFPVMIGSILVATVYLMIAHVVFQWH